MRQKMTIDNYWRKLKWLQASAVTVPFVSGLFDKHSGVPFPPMGDNVTSWRFFAFAVTAASAFLPYFLLPRRRRPMVIVFSFALLVAASALYLNLESQYVIAIPHPGGAATFVVRGTVRNPDLKEPYASMADEDLIQNSGQSDSALELAYQRQSLRANRRKLFWTYVGSLVMLELLLGAIAAAADGIDTEKLDQRSITS
jgi:hypothetical protein